MKSILINKKLSITFIFVITFLFFNFFAFEMVNAQGMDFTGDEGEIEMDVCPDGSEASAIGCLDDKVRQLNRLGGGVTVSILIGRVIKIVMGVIGSIALAMFIFGGITWMTARGNAEKTALAIRTLAWSTLGIIVILSSYIIVQFVFEAF
jgi:hypothetical protein